MVETNAERVRRGFDAISRGDFDPIGDLLAPDVKWHGGDPSGSESCQDREQALAVMRRAHEAGGIGELVDVVESGDKVMVVMRPAQSASEERPREVANLTTFRDGQVIEMVHYPDPSQALAALGVS